MSGIDVCSGSTAFLRSLGIRFKVPIFSKPVATWSVNFGDLSSSNHTLCRRKSASVGQ
jgi:hypothetical protein